MEPTQLCQGLRPCQQLVQINKQIPWICGFFSPAAPVRGEKRDPLCGREEAGGRAESHAAGSCRAPQCY